MADTSGGDTPMGGAGPSTTPTTTTTSSTAAKKVNRLEALMGGDDSGVSGGFGAPSVFAAAAAAPVQRGGGLMPPPSRPPTKPAAGAAVPGVEVKEQVVHKKAERVAGPPSLYLPDTDTNMDDGAEQEDPYLCRANDAISLRFVRSVEEIEQLSDEGYSRPCKLDFTHQFFGDKERIYGYKGLNATIYFAANTMAMYVDVQSEGVVSEAESDGVPPDDVAGTLHKCRCEDSGDTGATLTTKQALVEEVSKPAEPVGNRISEYTRNNRTYEIYSGCMAEDESVRVFHARAQILTKMYIDGAVYVDDEDPRWVVHILYERRVVNGVPVYLFVGYTTVYTYYVYPDKARLRLSQMIIPPPFQRQGHGAALLQSVYDEALSRDEVIEVTVEEPNENFSFLRDLTDLRNCRAAGYFPAGAELAWSTELCREIQSKLKIIKQQVRRCYEVHLLDRTDAANPEAVRDTRLSIKARLYRDNQEILEPAEPAERKTALASMYNNLEKVYKNLALRLSVS